MKKYSAFIVMLAFFGMNEAMCQWLTSGSNIYNSNTGNVGIGISSPTTLLQVAKNMTEPTITVRNLGGIGGATYTMTDDVSGANWKFKATNTGGFKIRDHANSLDVFLIEPNSSANAIYIKSGGNVGIGTTNPDQRLEVNGSIELPATINSSTGVIYKEGTPFLHDYKAPSAGSIGQNVFLGKNAGNFTLPGGNNYQSSDNTGIGTSTLVNLTTGYANTAVGSFAMNAVQGGWQNSAVGLYGLFANTSGNQNSILGAYASMGNTIGTGNVSVGFEANYYNQTGSSNTVIGYRAGKGSAIHNKSGNVFIGSFAGYYETGSNKLYIDNSNTSIPLIGGDFNADKVFLNGTVGIGTSTPAASARLEIAGTDKGFLPPRLTIAQILAIVDPVAGLMVFNTTTNKPNYFDGASWRDFNGNIDVPVIGAFWEGGIVYYIDGTGEHGLISAVSDQSVSATWGCMGNLLGATYDGYGTGETNTAIITAACNNPGQAATICNDLVLNNQSDWYLPATWELTQIFDSSAGVGGFEEQVYWTSCEFNPSVAYSVLYGTPYTTSGYLKDYNMRVRCIRNF